MLKWDDFVVEMMIVSMLVWSIQEWGALIVHFQNRGVGIRAFFSNNRMAGVNVVSGKKGGGYE